MTAPLAIGLVEYLRTLDMMKEYGWSSRRVIPHGGHQLSFNIAAGLGLGGNESYPGIFEPFGGCADNHRIMVKLVCQIHLGLDLKLNQN